ncbi:hypothetical protein IEQ34_026062 [Dendrobium chrysotoxum]|uniref:NADH dehydrogenase subunit 3 n=1 Tax=Dendrobium chrysotoxum TaxID=161865 RepID=A0AAV7FNC6_DENCH|nr:hypothetical protein IEQ34_026062 [Dendrobium chrysotoxum]
MGDAWVQFRIRYYMFALVFVVFDVETVFLYPWAMSFDVLGVSVFIEAFIFVLIPIVGSVYAWRKGALYEQMPEPKYVIAMGACTITGGMFSTDSYSTVRGVDKFIPVDVYLPGCPPKPEAIIDAITKLRKKISRKIFQIQKVSIFLRISESGRVPLCRIRNSGSIINNFIVNVKYSYKEKCGRDEEDAGSFI